jgi:hypothetical protein
MAGAAIAMFIAIPFYFLWNGLAPVYFTFLPAIWRYIPFWDCTRLMLLAFIIRGAFSPFTSSKEKK